VKLALRIAVAAALIAAVLLWIGDNQASGPEKIAGVLSSASRWLVLAVFCIASLDRALMAFKWKLLLRSRGLRLPFLRALNVYCTSLMWGLFLPSTVGADALRVGMTIRSGLPANEVVASVVVERMVGFLVSLVMGLLGLVILSVLAQLEGPWLSLWWMGSLLLLGAIGAVALSFSRSTFDRIFERLPKRLREQRLLRRLQNLHATYVEYCTDGRSIALFALLTFGENAVSILMCWASALALHVEVGLLFVAGVLPLTILVARLPVSIDGLGVFEGTFAGLMLLGAVPEQEAISVALLGRIVQIAAWAPWWIAHVVGTRELRPPESLASKRDPDPRSA